jgi:hypothetical protein
VLENKPGGAIKVVIFQEGVARVIAFSFYTLKKYEPVSRSLLSLSELVA